MIDSNAKLRSIQMPFCTFLIHYLRTPEEKVENIFMLYGADKNNKLRRRLIYDALGIIQSQQE